MTANAFITLDVDSEGEQIEGIVTFSSIIGFGTFADVNWNEQDKFLGEVQARTALGEYTIFSKGDYATVEDAIAGVNAAMTAAATLAGIEAVQLTV